ncbi:MAG: zinc ribbon domain-containing protein [Saccharofermentanales bacterium]
MYCENCGSKNDDGSVFCISCGKKMASQNSAATGPAVQATPPPVQAQHVQTQQPVATPPPVQAQHVQTQQPVATPPPVQAQHVQTQQPVAQYAAQPAAQPKKKKKHGCLTFMLGFLAAIVLLGMAVYIFVPGLLRPYNYGVKVSKEAYESALTKLKYTKDVSPATGTLGSFKNVYGPTNSIDTALTSEEITSFLSYNRPPYYALSNTQVRINKDNTIDIATRIDVDYVFDHVLGGKYTMEQAIQQVPMLRFLPDKVNMAVNVEGKVVDNNFEDLDLNKVSLNGIPLPPSLFESTDTVDFVEKTLSDYMKLANEGSKADYNLIQVMDGNLVILAEFPSSLTRVPVN